MAFIVHVSLLLLLINTIAGQSICKANESYRSCGSACAETCDAKPQMCIAVCKSGCFCNEGYVRQSSAAGSPCVQRETCNKKEEASICGLNQEFRSCGSACFESCDSKPEFCTEQCVAGCFCKNNDYVRLNQQKNSPCIKRELCL
ncbi:hypothetical protein I4U23_004748 [Adineta vaga]|nr:hypothetical protein I4U23_004748 [Adineta vaga]